MLATKYCNSATRGLEALSSVADRKALPDRGIEFPGEPTRDFLQGVPRDPIDEIEVFRRLRRHEAKPRHRRGQRRVDVVWLDFALGWTARSVGGVDRRINDHNASQSVAIETTGQHGDEPAETVRNDHRRLVKLEHARILANRELFARK